MGNVKFLKKSIMTEIPDSQIIAVCKNMWVKDSKSTKHIKIQVSLPYNNTHIPENERTMSQSKTNNQQPYILQNHTLKNNRAYGKYKVRAEGSKPIQFCNQNTDKSSKNTENY